MKRLATGAFPRVWWVWRVLDAVPDFAMAGVFAITWVWPLTFGEQMVKRLMLVMLLEFIVVHSAAGMGVVGLKPGRWWQRVGRTAGLGVVYALFVAGFCLGFETWWPMGAFWALTANRLLGVLLFAPPDEKGQAMMKGGWGASGLCYILGVFGGTFGPWPTMGMTPEVVKLQQFGDAGGLWIDHPSMVMAAGVIYFGLMGVYDLFGREWFAAAQLKAKARKQ
jgi:hypothetical protein